MDEANGNDEDEEEEVNVDDMPVTQEDAWAVIRCVCASSSSRRSGRTCTVLCNLF